MSRGPIVPEEWSADCPHPDPRREGFCQRVARGMSGSAAYKEISDRDITDGTARSNALKMRREAVVAARIDAIRAAREAVEIDDFEAADLAALMRECTQAFEAAYIAAERVGASPVQLSRIRRAMTVHLNRVSHVLESGPEPDAPAAPVALPTLHACTCHD